MNTETEAKPTVVLVDGNNYVYRAYYAIPELSNSKGFPTNAIYGFTNMLIKLLREQKPDYVAVAFDMKGPTFRHEAFEAYKATRKPMPEPLRPQIDYITNMSGVFPFQLSSERGSRPTTSSAPWPGVLPPTDLKSWSSPGTRTSCSSSTTISSWLTR